MLDLIVRGGQVVTPDVVATLDIGIQDGQIAMLGQPDTLGDDAGRVIDATGKIVLPGGIEPHAHIGQRVPINWAGRPDVYTQSPEAASRAAAFGGVTTIIDFARARQRDEAGALVPSIEEDIEARRLEFAEKSYTDFAFHYTLSGEVAPETLDQIAGAVQAGIASFKVFMTFGGRVPHGHIAAVFEAVAAAGGIMAVHAEDDEIVTYMTQKLVREGRDQGHNLHLVHNNLSEDVAFRAVIRMARQTGVAIYFVHTTAREGVEAVAEAHSTDFTGSKEAIAASLLNYPDFVLFDLDPYIYSGKEAAGEEPELNRKAYRKTVEVAQWLKELLDAASLSSFVKTSGATGLHIYVPVRRDFDYSVIRSIAETLGGFLVRAHPRDVTMEWSIPKRAGKIFFDANQNARVKSLASAYSPRAKPGAPVSMPLRWDELDEVYPTDFTILTAPDRIAEVGDLWADILGAKHDIAALIDSA